MAFLEKAICCSSTSLIRGCLLVAAEALLSGDDESDPVAEQLLGFADSLEDGEIRLESIILLADVLSERGLPQLALRAVETALGQLEAAGPLTFIDAVRTAADVIGRASSQRDAGRLYEALVRHVEAYEPVFDFFRAEALAATARGLADLPVSPESHRLRDTVQSAAAGLAHPLFRDYVRVSLVGADCQLGRHEDAARGVDSVEDPLCRTWALALTLGSALRVGAATTPAVRRLAEDGGRSSLPPAQLLLRLAKEVVSLASGPVFAPVAAGADEAEGEKTGYPRLCALAIADIASSLAGLEGLTENDTQTLGDLMEGVARSVTEIPLKWGFFAYEAASGFLRQAELIRSRRPRGAVLSAALDVVSQLREPYRWTFLQELVVALVRTGDRELLDAVVGALPEYARTADQWDGVLGVLTAIRGEVNPPERRDVLSRFVDQVAELEGFQRSRRAQDLIVAIPQMLDGQEAEELLSRVGGLCEGEDPAVLYRKPLVAMIEAYAQLGLWEQARLYAEGLRDDARPHALTRLGFLLDAEGRSAEARALYVEALETIGDPGEPRRRSQVHAALAGAFAQLGGLRTAFEEMDRIPEPYYLAAALTDVCQHASPFPTDSAELKEGLSLVDAVLRQLTDPCDQMTGLAAKARFLKRAGLAEESREAIAGVLGIMINLAKQTDGDGAFRLARLTTWFRDLLVESDDAPVLKVWYNAGVIIYKRFGYINLLENMAEVLGPSAIARNEWLVPRMLDVLRHSGGGSLARGLMWGLSSLLRTVRKKEPSVAYWEQFIAVLPALKLAYGAGGIERVFERLPASLLESAVGGEMMRLLRRLCGAIWVAGRPSRPASEVRRGVHAVVRMIVEKPGLEQKDLALREILAALRPSREHPWTAAAVAEGLARLGQEQDAASLFKSAMELSDEIEEGFLRDVEQSELAVVMARSGFSSGLRPLLERLRGASGLFSEQVRKNVAIALLYCDEVDAAISLAREGCCGEGRAAVEAELLVNMISRRAGGDAWLRGGRAVPERQVTDESMELPSHDIHKHLAAIQEAPEGPERDECLFRVATALRRLPLPQATAWLACLPTFSGDDEVWEALCSDYDYGPGAVRGILSAVPHAETESSLLRDLSNLGGTLVGGRLRLHLCAHAVLDANCFAEVLCDTLRNCTDAEVLREAQRAVLAIEAGRDVSERKRVLQRAPMSVAERSHDVRAENGGPAGRPESSAITVLQTRQPAALEDHRQDELERLLREIEKATKVERSDPFHHIVGKSLAIRGVLDDVARLGDSDAIALITGETGVGKEVVARAIWANSNRGGEPFIVANVGGTSNTQMAEDELFGHVKGAFTGANRAKEGKFALADGGTLFLDEIGELDVRCQVNLLRVLQEREYQPIGGMDWIPVDARVIAATNRDLREAVEQGTFRGDLLWRLVVYPIHIPPLRERKEDIPLLAAHFLARHCKDVGRPTASLSDAALKKLLLYDWPGNVRELENCIQRALLRTRSNTIEPSDLVLTGMSATDSVPSPEVRERKTLVDALQSSFTVGEAIRNLGLPRSTFYDKLEKHGLRGRARQMLRRSS